MGILYFDITTWILSIFVTVIVYILYMSWHFLTFWKIGVKGPTPVPLFGTLLEDMKMDMIGPQMERMKKYGKVYGVFEGRIPHMYVSDPAMLKEILVKQFHNFTNRRVFDGFTGDLDFSLPNLKGEHWNHVRSVLSPAYSSGKIKKMVPLIDDIIKDLMENIKLASAETNQVDIKKAYSSFTADTIAATAFGIRINSQKDPDDPFVKNIRTLSEVQLQSLTFLVASFMPFLMKPLNRLFGVSFVSKEAQEFFRNVIIKEIKNRQDRKQSYVDFLQLMYNAHVGDQNDSDSESTGDKGLSVKEIFGNSMIFFFAGYDTTSAVLTMLSYHLALNPEIQERLYTEIQQQLGDARPNYENVQQLQYLDMCINETLRLCPPSTKLDRECTATTVVEGIKIPKGLIIDVPIYAIHHSTEYWEDPERFDPERFSPENKAKHSPFQFLPFGYGRRNCIGMRLALIEAKTALTQVLKNFKFSTCEKTEIPPKFGNLGLLSPKYLWLSVEKR